MADLLSLPEEVCELSEVESASSVDGEEGHLLKQLLDLQSTLELLDESLEGNKVEMAGFVGVGLLRPVDRRARASVRW